MPTYKILVCGNCFIPLFDLGLLLALEEVMRSDTFILLATQKNASDEDPTTEAIYEVGTLASILQLLKLPEAPSRYWSRALSARKWSSTPIAASITRPRPSRSATRW